MLRTAPVSSSTGENPPANFIALDAAADLAGEGSALQVRYRCSGRGRLALEVVVSTPSQTDLLVFRRKWMSGASRVHRVRRLLVRWPPSILYQRDFFKRRVLEARNATARAQLDHLGEDGTHHGATLTVFRELSLPGRLAKPADVCPSWSTQAMWQLSSAGPQARPREQGQQNSSLLLGLLERRRCPDFLFSLPLTDTIDLLSFPLASTGEHFGVVRRFRPFIDAALEEARRGAVTRPRCANTSSGVC